MTHAPHPGKLEPAEARLGPHPAPRTPQIEPQQMAFLENVAALLTTNPQSLAWAPQVKACLGDRFRPCLPVWCSRNVELDDNHRLIGERLWELLPGIRNRLRGGFPATGRERAIYQSAAILALYSSCARQLGAIVRENGVKVPFWGQLERLYTELLAIKGLDAPPAEDLLGLFYQAYRCWYFPFTLIPGAAPITARARAAIVEASLADRAQKRAATAAASWWPRRERCDVPRPHGLVLQSFM